MPKTLEEEYEESLKGYDHPSLSELYKRHPELQIMAFKAGLYERLWAIQHPEEAAKEKDAENEQPPTM